MPDWCSDVLFVAGAASVCVGLGMVWLPLAVVSAGVFAIYMSWRVSK